MRYLSLSVEHPEVVPQRLASLEEALTRATPEGQPDLVVDLYNIVVWTRQAPDANPPWAQCPLLDLPRETRRAIERARQATIDQRGGES